jgi:hypothetical protein
MYLDMWHMRKKKVAKIKIIWVFIYISLMYLDKWTGYLDKWVRYLDRKIITSHGLYGESRWTGGDFLGGRTIGG